MIIPNRERQNQWLNDYVLPIFELAPWRIAQNYWNNNKDFYTSKLKKRVQLELVVDQMIGPSESEPYVNIDHTVIDTGTNKMKRTGWVPASVAHEMGWISETIYDKVMQK